MSLPCAYAIVIKKMQTLSGTIFESWIITKRARTLISQERSSKLQIIFSTSLFRVSQCFRNNGIAHNQLISNLATRNVFHTQQLHELKHASISHMQTHICVSVSLYDDETICENSRRCDSSRDFFWDYINSGDCKPKSQREEEDTLRLPRRPIELDCVRRIRARIHAVSHSLNNMCSCVLNARRTRRRHNTRTTLLYRVYRYMSLAAVLGKTIRRPRIKLLCWVYVRWLAVSLRERHALMNHSVRFSSFIRRVHHLSRNWHIDDDVGWSVGRSTRRRRRRCRLDGVFVCIVHVVVLNVWSGPPHTVCSAKRQSRFLLPQYYCSTASYLVIVGRAPSTKKNRLAKCANLCRLTER